MALIILQTKASADTPENKGRGNVTASMQHVAALGDYNLFVADGESLYKINSDTVYTIAGSHGVPHTIIIYAAKDNEKTDSIFLDEYSQQNFTINFTGVLNNKLMYEKTSSEKSSNDTSSAGAASQSETLNPATWSKTTEIFFGIATSAILGLIVIFFWRKRKNRNLTIDQTL